MQSFSLICTRLLSLFCAAANREEALVKYILAAETGVGLAQSNVAHLCEVHLRLFSAFNPSTCGPRSLN